MTRLPPEVGPFGQLRIADADLDLVRLEPELARDRFRDDAAGAGADVLHRGGGDETAALDRKLDLGSDLPKIRPKSRCDADAASVAAGLRPPASAQAPGLEPDGPVVKALPVGIGIPALAQGDRVGPEPKRRLVDRLLEREGHRRAARGAEGAARRQVADDVIVGEFLRLGAGR